MANLLQGTLDMLILRTLQLGPAHSHQIAKHIQRTTDDVLQVEHGSLYPALHRLERKGWLASKWETAGKEQKREFTYYRLTAAGKKQLAAEESKWTTRRGHRAGNVARQGGLNMDREDDLDRELKSHLDAEAEEQGSLHAAKEPSATSRA